ncbi:MAG: NADH:ubiquinone oxidoreductase [Paracoccaceae bacterium]|jgi:predicted flap endonuclease-1-like 5' DNA nuclease|nr:NADH:ubiquinone oxidoreductase [Paracoccaceae bacterium]
MKKQSIGSGDTALGAVAVAGVFAAVGSGMAAVMWGFDINQTGGTFIGLFAVILLVLLLGWRDPQPPGGGKRTPTAQDHMKAGTAPTASTSSAASSAAGSTTSAAAAVAPSSGTAQTAPAPATADAGAGDVGTKPRLLAAPSGEPDDLKQIKGVGPALEKLCHSLGIYHFDQIAKWTDAEVAWVDEHLEGFKGRVSRDDWVSQAKTLASGGSTEFSEKVSKGDVY